MAEPATSFLPTDREARDWVGWKVDEVGGSEVGRVHGFFVDAVGGQPAWLIAALGGRRIGARRPSRLVAIPLRDCAAGGGRVWVGHGREAIGTAPAVDPARVLLREHELTICSHFGIDEESGRAAEIVARPAGEVTSRPI